MGHYAKIEDGIVTQVIVADGPDWCEDNLGGEWIQTSYNMQGGVHSGGKRPLNKNYAGVGYTFDGVGFAAPKPYSSWLMDSGTYLWNAPVAMPTDGGMYSWSESEQLWQEITTE